MNALLLLCLCSSLQAPAAASAPFVWTGKWVTTVKPAAGEAPMISPSFTIEQKGGKLYVTLESERESSVASVFQISETESLLMVRWPPTGGGARTIMLRPAEEGRARLELLVEFAEGSRAQSFYYSEVFRRSK